MENVVGCDLMEEKSNGKAIFRIVYFSQNAHDFKHYDFETDSDDAGENYRVCKARDGRGGTPLYKLYSYVLHQRVWFFSRFGVK